MDVTSEWFLLNEESIVTADIIHSDGLRVLSFSSTSCLQILSRAETIFADGTFKITPWPWYQLFIIHASVGPSSSVPIMFSLLPDKTRRSYDDMFQGLKKALMKRELELSASYFMSDFENNIRLSFSSEFPEVQPKGCLFHFAKAIWSKVKKAGLQTYYSVKSSEPKFGSFIRTILGLPFLQIEDLGRGLKNIENMGTSLTNIKCKDFAKDMIRYIKSFWLYGSLDPKLWNMFMYTGSRTNNQCEGYNFKLNSKKHLSKHPNVYLLVVTLKDELVAAHDNAMGN